MRPNIAALVNLADSKSTTLEVTPWLTAFSEFIYALNGGVPAAVFHTKVDTFITANSSVVFLDEMPPDEANLVVLIV
jgi:hypothetical protein